jgi:hypothetical protein
MFAFSPLRVNGNAKCRQGGEPQLAGIDGETAAAEDRRRV